MATTAGKQLAVDGVSMGVTNAHTLVQNDVENSIDINELKRRIERRDAENKRKDREVILLQKEILNLTKETQDLRDRNEQLQQSLANARLLTAASRQDDENKLTSSVISDLQMKLDRSEHALNEALGDNEVAKATIVTLKEQLVETLGTSEVRAREIQSVKEDYYSLNIKLKTLQIRLQEKDAEYERLQTINESFIKSERQLKGQLEHEKTVTYEHERTINELLATNKRMMASNLIKSETNQFLTSELSEMRDGAVGERGGAVLTSTEMEALKEIEKRNVTLSERNKELTKSIELHMDLLQRCEAENNVLKLKLTEETDLREELQHEMKSQSDNQSGKENTFQQLKKEVVKLRKENKILAEKCDELMRQPAPNPRHGAQSQGGGRGGGSGGDENSLVFRPGYTADRQNKEERKRLKLSEETVKALRNRISFLLEQLTQLSTQSTAWNEQKLIFKSQISSLLEANISLRERLLTVQRSFMERSLYELDHPAVRRNAKPIFLTEGEEERVMATGKWRDREAEDDGEQHQQYGSPEAIIEGAIVSHSLAPMPLRGLSQDPNAREARLLEYSMRSELGQPIPYTIEGYIERTMFDTLCAFTSGGRTQSSEQSTSKGKPLMKPKVQKNYFTTVGTDGLYTISLEQGQYAHITTQADMSIRAEAEELLAGLQIPAFLKFVQTRPPEKFLSLFTEKLTSILNFLRGSIHDYVNQLGESRITNAKLQSKISHSDLQVSFMKRQFSSERLSKQKNIMKYIREQLQLSDYRKLIYDISALGRDSLDEIDVNRKDLSEELRRENPSYYQMTNATHAERYQGLESQKLRGLMTQLRGVAEKLATTALHHFGEEKGAKRDEVVGSLDIKLYDSQVDDETCHGIIGLLSGALQGTASGVDGAEDKDHEENDEAGGGGAQSSLSRGDKVLASELGITNSEDKFSTASMLAKSFLKIQSNYLDRLLLINLKDNSLTDISCKILCTVVEKSTTLRMLDIRGNLISSNGAKMLFDATRRNPTVLYVTQKQNGLMVEGHREIMGSSPSDKRATRELSKSGVISLRASAGRDTAVDEGNGEDYQLIMDHAADQEAFASKKHPLRIDLRENNPEQMVAERLLEATEFTFPAAAPNGHRASSVSESHASFGEEASASGHSHERAVREAPARSTGQVSQRQRPHSANLMSGNSQRPPRLNNQSLVAVRPSSGTAMTRNVGISGEGIRMAPSRPSTGAMGARDEDDGFIDDNDDDEAEGLLGFGEENEQNSYLRSKLIEKKNERLEGGRGAGVGSLLDTEIRKMQIQSSEAFTGAGVAPGNGLTAAAHRLQKPNGKRLKRKVVVSAGNGLVRRSQQPGLSALPAPINGTASSRRQAMTLTEKKSEMKGVYATPVIRPLPNPKAGGGAQLVKASSGFVDKKRIVTSAANPQRLSLSKSAPQINRPTSAPMRGSSTGVGVAVAATSALNPYTQRALNPGILF